MKHTLVARVQRPARRPEPRGQPLPAPRLQHRQPDRRRQRDRRDVSRMTIVVDTRARRPHLVAANLRKLVPVVDVRT